MRGTRFLVAGALLALGVTAVVNAQPGGGFGRGGGGVTQLVTNKAVQAELKMSEEQVDKLKGWGREFMTKSFEIMKDKGVEFGKGGGGGKGGGFSPEMQEKMAEAMSEINKVAMKELGEVLKEEQVTRLKQIQVQQQGINAFVNTDIAETLKLTDSQKTSIKGIMGDFQKESREIRTEGGKGGGGKGGGGKGGFGGNPETQKKIAKVEKEAVSKAVDLLDDSQKTAWKGLNGDAFDLTKLQPVFGKKKD